MVKFYDEDGFTEMKRVGFNINNDDDTSKYFKSKGTT